MVADRRRTWGEDRVYYLDENEQLKRLPAAWTSAGAVDEFREASGGHTHFRIQDLLDLAVLVAHLAESEPGDGTGEVLRG